MPSYVHLQKLPPESVEQLVSLFGEFNPPFATSIRRRIGNDRTNRLRMGSNGIDSLSVYRDTRWFKWTAEQRNRFKAAFTNPKHTNALVGYFIHFPQNTGFLDVMESWKGQGENSSIIIAYAMYDGQSIYIEDEQVVLQSGEGIAFHVSSVHQVKKSKLDALWANTMVLGKLSDLT